MNNNTNVAAGPPPTLLTLVSFNRDNGADPNYGLIADANGDLFGMTGAGGADNDGTVFEVVNDGTVSVPSYASSPTTLVSFTGDDGAQPVCSLMADAKGNLFGTTAAGGADNAGTVFEMVNTGTVSAPSYAATPTTLASFNIVDGEHPFAGLMTDAKGDLLGTTTDGGAIGDGTVFEIANNGTVSAPSYASSPTTLVSFTFSNGENPESSLIADANGDLFGTTTSGGAGNGTWFEIVNNGTDAAPSYASTPTKLVSFTRGNEEFPYSSLIADANGDLFGTTIQPDPAQTIAGTVFELVNNGTVSAPSYAATPTTLVTFTGSDGGGPFGSLLLDANGDLFGTTGGGGTNGDGTVFEIVNDGTASAPHYASSPTMRVSFNYGNGASPNGDLFADANGNLLGTTINGGVNDDGTVFEITNAGVVPPVAPDDFSGTGTSDILFTNPNTAAAMWEITKNQVAGGGVFEPLGAGDTIAATGDFYGNGKADILLSNAAAGLSIWEMNGTQVVGGGGIGSLGAGWSVAGTGDFNGDGMSDILLANTNGGVAMWDMNGTQATDSGTFETLGAGWSVAGTGDFYGNGPSDVLLANTNGELALWEMQGSSVIGGGIFASLGANSGWSVAGVGDFDGNGTSDLLLENTNGALAMWEMDGASVIGGGVFENLGANSGWSVGAVGDYNGDGFADILLHNTSGANAIWDMNGTNVVGGGGLPSIPAPWTIQH